MPELNCAEGQLISYVPNNENPWTLKKLQHFYRRLTFGGSLGLIESNLNQNPVAIANQIIDEAMTKPFSTEPEWAYWSLEDYDPNPAIRNEQIVAQYLQWGRQWLSDMYNNGLRDRMSWYWHNHFVTKLESYQCPSWMYQYHKLLQQYALGNFREFTREMGKTPAMLVFLNGVQNTKFDPNENYARELYEIFTLGANNGYTQEDIVNTARALTGWNGVDTVNLCGEVEFIPAFWDSDEKTIFGQTGNWGYDDVIDILFEQKGALIAKYICAKLYREFVNPVEDEFIIDQLAETFLSNDFELEPVFRQLFSSEHFFDEAHFGTIIPGHIEYFFTFLREMDYPSDEELLYLVGFSADEFNQRIFNPTDVSGWPGNRDWINSSSLPYRWKGIADIMGYFYLQNGANLDELKILAQQLTQNDESDPEVVVNAIIEYILPNGLQFETEYDEALKVFKAEVPENYFDSGQWNLLWEYAPAQVYFLVAHLANVPEFQLK